MQEWVAKGRLKAGVVASTVLVSGCETLVAGTPPKVTRTGSVVGNRVPRSVTGVPPCGGPKFGEMPLSDGRGAV